MFQFFFDFSSDPNAISGLRFCEQNLFLGC